MPESRLLRRFFPDARETLSEGVTIKLFRYHFLLYHHLYRLAQDLEKQRADYFLYIRTINVYLFRKPAAGHCEYFDDKKPGFCGMKIDGQTDAGRYCAFHRKLLNERIGGGTVTDADARGFYLDLKNMEEMDEQKLKMWQKGILTYAASHEEIERSLEILGLPPDFTLKRLKNRYRYLCKQYHPDTSASPSKTAALNEARSEDENPGVVFSVPTTDGTAADEKAGAGSSEGAAADGGASAASTARGGTVDFRDIHRAYQTLLTLITTLY